MRAVGRLYKSLRRVFEGYAVFVLEGSTCRRSSELQKFKDSTASVLLLCLEDSIAGLNLTCSSHLILCGPMCADIETAKNMESQAVGRLARIGQSKEVVVHHFVSTATCEEDLWKAQHTNTHGVYDGVSA